MLALSIQQPWAWAILHAGKNVENRTWTTGIRGRIAIHAGKTIDKHAVTELRAAGYDVPIDLPTGGVVGEATITNCLSPNDARLANNRWASGPLCFTLEDPKPYDHLIPMRGMLGFFEVDVESKEATE